MPLSPGAIDDFRSAMQKSGGRGITAEYHGHSRRAPIDRGEVSADSHAITHTANWITMRPACKSLVPREPDSCDAGKNAFLHVSFARIPAVMIGGRWAHVIHAARPDGRPGPIGR